MKTPHDPFGFHPDQLITLIIDQGRHAISASITKTFRLSLSETKNDFVGFGPSRGQGINSLKSQGASDSETRRSSKASVGAAIWPRAFPGGVELSASNTAMSATHKFQIKAPGPPTGRLCGPPTI
jgi:hypothetical protein